MLALLLGLISNASFATDNARANLTQRFYNLSLWDNHRYGDMIKDWLAHSYATQLHGSDTVKRSQWIDSDTKHAWIQGYTGQGVEVLVADDFRDYRPMAYFGNGDISYAPSHGDTVSLIIEGGSLDMSNTEYVGIAPGANVTKFNRYSSDRSVSNNYANYDIVNASHSSGGGTIVDSAAIASSRDWWVNGSGRHYVRPISERPLIVKSAGNNPYSCKEGELCTSSNLGLLQYRANQADQTLLVGQLENGRVISTKAGILKDHYVVDDGSYFLNFEQNGRETWYNLSGTSFAVPTVAGKAAIIKSKFPNLNGSQLATLIKTTADDLGAPGVDEVYGHGKVNLLRALSPVGNLR